VAPGGTVTWTNSGKAPHTVTADNGSFDSGIFGAGKSFSHVFQTEGTYTYVCTLHPQMTGSVRVSTTAGPASGGGAAPAGNTGSGASSSNRSGSGSSGSTPSSTSSTPSGSAAPAAGATVVEMLDSSFAPAAVTVTQGSTVTWRNVSTPPHTATADNGSFDSGILDEGGSFSQVFNTPGTYSYLCQVHPSMTGSVTVTASAGGAAGAASAAPDATGSETAAPVPSSPPQSAPAPSGAIEIKDFTYTPANLTVDAGTAVLWVNLDVAPHSVTGDAFDSGLMKKGATFSQVFVSPGVYDYLCVLHPEMTGTITVRGADGQVPAAGSAGTLASVPAAETPIVRPTAAGVQMLDFEYSPATLTVPVGTTVTWVNSGVAPHTVTAADNSFDSGMIKKGASFSRTFTSPGTLSYLCTYHPNMTGTLIITPGVGRNTLAATAQDDASSQSQGQPGQPGQAGAASRNVPGAQAASGERVALTSGQPALAARSSAAGQLWTIVLVTFLLGTIGLAVAGSMFVIVAARKRPAA
jgi:plastocyanin